MGDIIKFPTAEEREIRNDRFSSVSSKTVRTNAEELPVRLTADGRALSFRIFNTQVDLQDLPGLGESLSYLLGVSQTQGVQCAKVFLERLKNDPDLTMKTESMIQYVKDHKPNDALILLAICFGLQGSDAINVLQHLRSQDA